MKHIGIYPLLAREIYNMPKELVVEIRIFLDNNSWQWLLASTKPMLNQGKKQ